MDGPIEEQVNFAFPDHFEINYKDVYEFLSLYNKNNPTNLTEMSNNSPILSSLEKKSELIENEARKEEVDFLQKGFYGGTDPEPALRGGIKLMNENKWERADLLMISDFEMGNLSPDLKNVIEAQKKKKSRFFSLKIGTGANQDVLNCFNEQWEYNSQSKDAVRTLAKNMVDMNRGG